MDRSKFNKPIKLRIPAPKTKNFASGPPRTLTIAPLNAVIASSFGRPPILDKTKVLFRSSQGSKIPTFISWGSVGTGDVGDPNRVQGRKLHRYRMAPAFNQYECGCCWVVSTCTAFADRYGIANDQKPIESNIISVMTCCTKTEYKKSFAVVPTPDCNFMSSYSDLQSSDNTMGICSGAVPYAAAMAISRNGLAEVSKQPYTKDLIDCGAGCTTTQMNRTIIKKFPCDKKLFEGRRIHMDPTEKPVYISSSLDSKGPPEHYVDLTKKALLDGPIVAGFLTTADFINIGTDPTGRGIVTWDQTGRVYVPGAYDTQWPSVAITLVGGVGFIRKRGIRIDDAPMGTGLGPIGNIMCGFHAIVIIGYGEMDMDYVPNKTVRTVVGRDGRRKLPFWVCRNSWGTEWPLGPKNNEPYYSSNGRVRVSKNEYLTVPPGCWLHAMWPNDSLGLDVPITYNGSDYGATMVMVASIEKNPVRTNPKGSVVSWRDSDGYGCLEYGKFGWCTPMGQPGPGWKKEWGSLPAGALGCLECGHRENFSDSRCESWYFVVIVVVIVLAILALEFL